MHGVQNYNKTEAKDIVAEAKVNHDTILQNKRRRRSYKNGHISHMDLSGVKFG